MYKHVLEVENEVSEKFLYLLAFVSEHYIYTTYSIYNNVNHTYSEGLQSTVFSFKSLVEERSGNIFFGSYNKQVKTKWTLQTHLKFFFKFVVALMVKCNGQVR